ncbi:MAG: endonuclease/exonuclease/phosphatase family protein [Oscillospiraceae bacterium]|nr:endonuclease/exonuclease/phosphatase family protein [Oscillospiraceae bacterium]
MRIATWNIERLRHKKELESIIANCAKVSADILVLTETDSQVKLDYDHCYSTASPENETVSYSKTETRVSIYTNYELVKCHATFNERVAVCVELKTGLCNLIVYGTVIGIYGNRHSSFMPDLSAQVADIGRLVTNGNPVCICGDYNCSFSDNYYFTKDGRAVIEDMLRTNRIELLTRNQPECIDHIAVSRDLVGDTEVLVKEWNLDKTLSDHKGIMVEFAKCRE